MAEESANILHGYGLTPSDVGRFIAIENVTYRVTGINGTSAMVRPLTDRERRSYRRRRPIRWTQRKGRRVVRRFWRIVWWIENQIGVGDG